MKCLKCGADISKKAKFCPYCGTKIENSEIPETSNSDAPNQNNDNNTVKSRSDFENTPTSFAGSIKSAFLKFWTKLSIFGKIFAVLITLFTVSALIAFLFGKTFTGIIALVQIIAVVISLLMKKQIIKTTKSWLYIVIIALALLMAVPYVNSFSAYGKVDNKPKSTKSGTETFDWSEIVLGDVLPIPDSDLGEININSSDCLSMSVLQISPKQYEAYVNACKEKGFSIEAEQTSFSFDAYNQDGHKLSLLYIDSEMSIFVNAPAQFDTIEWPNTGFACLIPAPGSTIGKIDSNSDTRFAAYLSKVSFEDYEAYIAQCSEYGFNIDIDQSDKRFTAKNADGYSLEVSYQGNSVVRIAIDEPKYTMSISIDCVENLIFSKYDVDISLDGVKKETLAHGEEAVYEYTVKRGSHTLTFSEKGASSVKGSVSIDDLASDVDASYKIYCHENDITIETIYVDRKVPLTENEVKITCTESSFLDTNYQDVITALKDMGFTNVQSVPVYDIIFGVTETGSTSSVTIGGSNSYKRGDIFSQNVAIVVAYHMPEEDNPSKIAMPMDSDDFYGKQYSEAEETLRGLGFTNISTDSITDYFDRKTDGEISSVRINGRSFIKGDKFNPDDKVSITYYVVEIKAPESVNYSTNDSDTVKDGNTGVYSYKKSGSSYDIYYIIDFEEGYVYRFLDGDGNETCDRIKIDSGDLNSAVIITYHDGGDSWQNALHFRWRRQPDHLIMEDNDHFEWDFYTTELTQALAKRDSKTIYDY